VKGNAKLTRAGALLPYEVFTGEVVQVATHFLSSFVCAPTGFNRPSAEATDIPAVAQRIQALAARGSASLLAVELRVMSISLL